MKKLVTLGMLSLLVSLACGCWTVSTTVIARAPAGGESCHEKGGTIYPPEQCVSYDQSGNCVKTIP